MIIANLIVSSACLLLLVVYGISAVFSARKTKASSAQLRGALATAMAKQAAKKAGEQ